MSRRRSLWRSLPHDSGDRWLLLLAVGALAVGLSMLGASGGVARHRHEMRVGYHAGMGSFERRPAGSLLWQRVLPEDPVYLHDELRSRNEPILVQFENGRRVLFPAGASVRIESLQPQRVEVSVLAGNVFASDDVTVREVAKKSLAMPSMQTILALPRLPVPTSKKVPHVDVAR